MNMPSPERTNRLVTCPECGVQMPARYLARHTAGHAPAALPEPAPAPDSTPAPERQRAGMCICPACAAFVAPPEFADHMQAQHAHWCPLCQAHTKDLPGHLSSAHRLKPITPAPAYLRHWQAQPRFICLGCQKKVSVKSYPKHEQPHGAARPPAQQTGKGRP